MVKPSKFELSVGSFSRLPLPSSTLASRTCRAVPSPLEAPLQRNPSGLRVPVTRWGAFRDACTLLEYTPLPPSPPEFRQLNNRDDADVVAKPPRATHPTDPIAPCARQCLRRTQTWKRRLFGLDVSLFPSSHDQSRRCRPESPLTTVSSLRPTQSYHDGAAGHPRGHVQALPVREGRDDAAGFFQRHDGKCTWSAGVNSRG